MLCVLQACTVADRVGVGVYFNTLVPLGDQVGHVTACRSLNAVRKLLDMLECSCYSYAAATQPVCSVHLQGASVKIAAACSQKNSHSLKVKQWWSMTSLVRVIMTHDGVCVRATCMSLYDEPHLVALVLPTRR